MAKLRWVRLVHKCLKVHWLVRTNVFSDPGTSVSLILLCIAIGVAVVTATGIAYRRDRQLSQRHLEVADFSFHSHSAPSASLGHYVAALRLKWRRLWISHPSWDIHMDSYDRLWLGFSDLKCFIYGKLTDVYVNDMWELANILRMKF